jgi:hypothetical protein
LIFDGVCESSYRKVCQRFNRQVRQSDEKGITPTSLQYEAKVEARSIQANQDKQVQQILSTHHFDEKGQPGKNIPIEEFVEQSQNTMLQQAFEEVCCEAPQDIQSSLNLQASAYEDPMQSTYVAIDDVCNKEQKQQRPKCSEEPINPFEQNNSRKAGKKVYKNRSFLFHTVAKIITAKGNYTITAARITLLWPFLIAVLLHNQLMGTKLIFLVDGQRVLHDYLIKRFKWRPIHLILDWYHLRKKIHRQAYMGLLKTDKRDQLMLKLEQLLWYGLVSDAINLINKIPDGLVKDQQQLEILKGYFERNKELIPNYALRKKMGLILSSNRVEKENDYIVAARQKNNGMSWSRTGSDALAIITTVQRNKELDRWLNENIISMKLAA